MLYAGEHLGPAGHLRRDVSRGGARLRRLPVRRRHGVARRPRHLQPAEACRRVRHDRPAGAADPAALAVSVRLCQAGAGQFRPAATIRAATWCWSRSPARAPTCCSRSPRRCCSMRSTGCRRARRDWLAANLVNSIQINAVLCVFNMLPLPPLDGGRVAVGLLPRALALPLARLEPYGILILMLFLFVLPYDRQPGGRRTSTSSGWLIAGPTERADPLRAGDDGAGRVSFASDLARAHASPAASRRWSSTSTATKGRSTCCWRWRASRRSISPRLSILALADQYLAFIAAQRRLRLEIAADYLVMAAWLAYLKSRLLLPRAAGRGRRPERRGAGRRARPSAAPAGRDAARRRRLDGPAAARPRCLSRAACRRGSPRSTGRSTSSSLYELLAAYGEGHRRSTYAVLTIEPPAFHSLDEALQRLAPVSSAMCRNGASCLAFLPEELRGGGVSPLGAGRDLCRDAWSWPARAASSCARTARSGRSICAARRRARRDRAVEEAPP